MTQVKIVMITSGQPSLNPRLVKEADTLADEGYEVVVIYAFWNDWGTAMDMQLLPSKKWTAIRAGGSPATEKFTYFISKVIHRFAGLAYKAGINAFAELAIARGSYFLVRAAIKQKAGLYIAHNLGALASAVKAAKKFGKPCGFDAEDLHRYEASNDNNSPDVKLKSFLENKYLPKTDYLTASSNQIAGAYKGLFKNISPVPIRNVFPVDRNVPSPSISVNRKLKLIWASQTIGDGRGLKDIFAALAMLNNSETELHLLGYLPVGQKAFIDDMLQKYPVNVHFHAPVPPNELPVFVSQFDIGLALEPAFSMNNDYALSNKIFTYLQAGLAVVASNTTAQQDFIERYNTIGKLYNIGDARSLANVLTDYTVDREQLLKAKTAAYELARTTLNWELESRLFLEVINKTINPAN